MPPAGATSSCRWHGRRWPWAPTGSSWRCTPVPRMLCPTARSRSGRPSSKTSTARSPRSPPSWAATSAELMTFVAPAVSLRGAVAVPGDKSISHRALLVGAISEGEVEITGLGRSADTDSTIAALRRLGVEVDDAGADAVRLRGAGMQGLRAPGTAIDCGNAGTLARLLAGILAGQRGQRFELTGDESLRARPMDRVADPLVELGAAVEASEGRLPMRIE